MRRPLLSLLAVAALSQAACQAALPGREGLAAKGSSAALGASRSGADFALFYGMDDYSGKDTSRDLKAIHAQLATQGSTARSSLFLSGDASTANDGFRTRVTQGQAWGQGFQALGELRTNQAPALRDFLTWVSGQGPKRPLHLTISTHGGGYGGILLDHDGKPEGWAPSMTLQKASKALAKGHQGARLATLNFDACMMATIEVGEALKGTTEILTGCEDFSFGGSTPYAEVAKALTEGRTLEGEAYAKHLVEATVRRGLWGDKGTRQWSAIRLNGAFDDLVRKVDRLAQALRRALPKERVAIQKAFAELPMFGAMAAYREHYGDFGQRDLMGLARALASKVQDPHVREAAQAVEAGTLPVLVAFDRMPSESMANGLAIFVVTNRKDATARLPRYRESLFAKHTQWDELLSELNP